MKRFIILTSLLTLFLLSISTPATIAAPPADGEDKATSGKLDEQINDLKEKIASRVSELNLVEKRGVIGTVKEVKGNQITLIDVSDNTRFVDVDEITKFSSSGSNGAFGISDLTPGTKISVLGTYNKQSKRILARFVQTHVVPERISGVIASIDARNFQITTSTAEQKEIKIDIDTTSGLYAYSNGVGLAKHGFSKLQVGDRVYVVGYPDKTDPKLAVASRLIVFIGFPKDPHIVSMQPTETVTIAPSGTGGKTINPIER